MTIGARGTAPLTNSGSTLQYAGCRPSCAPISRPSPRRAVSLAGVGTACYDQENADRPPSVESDSDSSTSQRLEARNCRMYSGGTVSNASCTALGGAAPASGLSLRAPCCSISGTASPTAQRVIWIFSCTAIRLRRGCWRHFARSVRLKSMRMGSSSCRTLSVSSQSGSATPTRAFAPRPSRNGVQMQDLVSGRSEIRTHESLSAPHAFQACALNHSATRPLTFVTNNVRGSAVSLRNWHVKKLTTGTNYRDKLPGQIGGKQWLQRHESRASGWLRPAIRASGRTVAA